MIYVVRSMRPTSTREPRLLLTMNSSYKIITQRKIHSCISTTLVYTLLKISMPIHILQLLEWGFFLTNSCRHSMFPLLDITDSRMILLSLSIYSILCIYHNRDPIYGIFFHQNINDVTTLRSFDVT